MGQDLMRFLPIYLNLSNGRVYPERFGAIVTQLLGSGSLGITSLIHWLSQEDDMDAAQLMGCFSLHLNQVKRGL